MKIFNPGPELCFAIGGCRGREHSGRGIGNVASSFLITRSTNQRHIRTLASSETSSCLTTPTTPTTCAGCTREGSDLPGGRDGCILMESEVHTPAIHSREAAWICREYIPAQDPRVHGGKTRRSRGLHWVSRMGSNMGYIPCRVPVPARNTAFFRAMDQRLVLAQGSLRVS
ncbi:hypothetical protein C8R45DRAFT_1004557 [Mycena sanguinolenta]|nr:hypothetical protein C8R45DRAFT_1004557 [Mycena sanguinolenta]